MRSVFVMLSLVALTACTSRVTGEIGTACMGADRSAANPQLCSCVQQAANRTLGPNDQIRAAEFFSDPQLAQDTRQSDNRGSEAFWQRYKVFTDTASRLCR